MLHAYVHYYRTVVARGQRSETPHPLYFGVRVFFSFLFPVLVRGSSPPPPCAAHVKSIRRRRICQRPRIDPVTGNPIKTRSAIFTPHTQGRKRTTEGKKQKKKTNKTHVYSTPSQQQQR